MNKDRLAYLLKRFHENLCNEDEMAELNEWFHSLNYGQKSFESLLKETGGKEKLAIDLFDTFRDKLRRERKKVITLRLFYQAAAILLIFVATGILFYNYKRDSKKVGTKELVKSDIGPGRNRAVLTLADGSKIFLDSAGKGELASQPGSTISKTANGQLLYTIAGTAEPGDMNVEPAYNDIQTPRGGQYQIILPDGSKVWLNAASSLRFPVRFNKKERRVELTGEAYFEVARNKDVPFKVYSGKQEVKVLGTQFNVKAYSDEPGISTTLLEGSVLVNNLESGQSRILKPGQQANITRDSRTIEIDRVNPDQEVSWKSGYFVFDNQEITGIMKTIGRWYDVDIEYRNIYKIEKFGGAFSRSSNLSEILHNLESLGNMHFKIEGRRVIVSD